MFDSFQRPSNNSPPDSTGLKVGLILLPLFFFFVYLGKAEVGFNVFIVVGLATIAIHLRWNRRKEPWFWPVILTILLLHIPLIFVIKWPDTKAPTLLYAMPIGFTDFFIIMGAIRLAEKIFSKGSSGQDSD